MDIRTLLSRVDIIENNNSSMKQYLSEGLYSTPEMQSHWKRIDEGFVQGYEKYLAEVALTPDQIQSIFKQASGGGTGAETKDPGKLAALVDKVLPDSQAANLEKTLPAPDAGAVQGFEDKANAAVQGLQGVDNSTKQSLMQWVKSGIQKPESQQLILAAVGAGIGGLISKIGPIISMIPGGGAVASAITGAVVAGAVAVASAKLQGKDWKTAFKGAIKPALMGGASAVIGNLATTAISAMTSGGGQQQPASADSADATTQKRGDSGWNSMKANTNPDGSPMTLDQINAAKDSQRAGNANDMSDPTAANPADAGKTGADFAGTRDANGVAPYATGSKQWAADRAAGKIPDLPVDGAEDFSGTATPQQQQAADDAIYKQAKDSGATGSTSNQQFTARPTNIQPVSNLDGSDRTGAASANSNNGITARPANLQPIGNAPIGQNFDAGIAPIGANGQPMRQVPMDSPEIGQAFNAGAAPIGANGQPMQQVPMDTGPTAGGVPIGSTPDGINRLTGKPISTDTGTAWNNMTPDQQAATLAQQQQQAADATQGIENAKQYWANKNPNTRSLKESFSESIYIDKQATLRKWLEQESRGLAVSGLVLKPMVKEGIMDSLKGMFGGKKGTDPAAGGVTADALNKAWTAAGSPTDSEEIAKVLQSAGVPAETVSKVFTDLKLPAPGAVPTAKPEDPAAKQAEPGATAPDGSAPAGQVNKSSDTAYSQAKKLVMSLTKQQQQQVMQYLQKQLGQA